MTFAWSMTGLLALCCSCSLAQGASGTELETMDSSVREPDLEDEDEEAVPHDMMDARVREASVERDATDLE